MGLESATYISDLVLTNPTGLDPKRQGDDHLRLIKTVLQNTFPNVTGSLDLTQAQVNNAAIKNEENTFTEHNFFASGKALNFNSTTTGSPLGASRSGLLMYNDGNGFIRNYTGDLTISSSGQVLIDGTNFDVTSTGVRIRGGDTLSVYDSGGDFIDISHDGSKAIITTAGTDTGSADIQIDSGGASTGLILEDRIFIAEQPTGALADKTGYGQLYTQHGSPSGEVWGDHTVLMFTDDTGDETQIGTSYKLITTVPIEGFGSPSPKSTMFLAKTGELVRLFFNITVNTTSTQTYMRTADFVIPSGWRPPVEQHFFVPIIDNGTTVMGQLEIESSGRVQWYNSLIPNPGDATFTASGNKGFYNNTPVIWHTQAGNT